MNYHHFIIEEGCCLREYYVKGKGYQEIARLLERNVNSVSREWDGTVHLWEIYPDIIRAQHRRKATYATVITTRNVLWEGGIGLHQWKTGSAWLPEQIANMPYGKKLPSFKTIYHWIDEQYLTCNTENIASEGKNAKKAGKQRAVSNR